MCGGELSLRAVEPEDITYLYRWENYQPLWGVSGTLTPFSRYTLAAFIESQGADIHTSRQLRLMVEVSREVRGESSGESESSGEGAAREVYTVGMVDLFEFEPHHLRAGVGVFITPEYQGQGYGRAAVMQLCDYARNVLGAKSLWCSCTVDNEASKSLFRACGFEEIGVRRKWVRVDAQTFLDEILFQKLF